MTWTNGNSRTSTPEHRRWARTVLTRDHYQCQGCGHQGHQGDHFTKADHIIPIAEGGPEHDPNNGQALCDNCHTPKTQAEATRGRARRSPKRAPEKHPGLC